MSMGTLSGEITLSGNKKTHINVNVGTLLLHNYVHYV